MGWLEGRVEESVMAHLVDRHVVERANTALMLGFLWAGLAACVIGAMIYDIAFWLASFYSLEGMTDEAIEWVQRAIKLGNENYPLFADSKKLNGLRAEPRFVELMDDLKQRWEARRMVD